MSGETSILLILLGISLVYYLVQPQEINYFYGFRTKKSLKNSKNWKKANSLAAKGWLYIMSVNLVFSILLTQICKFSSYSLLAVVLAIEFIGLFCFVGRKLD